MRTESVTAIDDRRSLLVLTCIRAGICQLHNPEIPGSRVLKIRFQGWDYEYGPLRYDGGAGPS